MWYDNNKHLVSFCGNYDLILLSLLCLFNASFVLRVLYFYAFYFLANFRLSFNSNNRKGQCFWQGYKLTQIFSFTFFIPAQIQKVVKHDQKSPKCPTLNNKTFLFHVQGTWNFAWEFAIRLGLLLWTWIFELGF